MIDESIILTFDGTIITGLFVFYAFLVVLAERFRKYKEELLISKAIRYLASVQLVFAISAILALIRLVDWALVVSAIGLIMLVIYFVLLIWKTGLIEAV
jgi:hypothetical protein